MLFQTGHHRAADAGEVILHDLGFGRRQVMDMPVQRRGPLALSKQGFHLVQAAFDVQKRGKQGLLVQWGQHGQAQRKKPSGTFPRASVSACAPTQGKSLLVGVIIRGHHVRMVAVGGITANPIAAASITLWGYRQAKSTPSAPGPFHPNSARLATVFRLIGTHAATGSGYDLISPYTAR